MRSSYFVVLLLITLAVCVQGNNAHRNLKGTSVANEQSDEERIQWPSFIEKIIASFRGSRAATKVLSKNPLLAKTVAENPSIGKDMQTLAKNKELVNSLKQTKSFDALKTAISKNPHAVDAAKAERFGMTMINRIRKIELVGDVKGMVIVYAILFLSLIGIGTVGFIKYHNTVNSYHP
ncbi:putative secreted RxLR effector peptide protein [Phytophthora cinnamomi]|uniref:putative secreted RxLR effector peptide protein n=1 Tax=Phytophthora cinnamomi TaxID=4785 RepID=UPI0035598723|nr:putative secreted RxLR effector peptide protein [Phytophthora cinnamomi]